MTTHTTRRRIAVALTASGAFAALATAGIAADPSEGTVDPATPKITWTGETTGSYLVLNPMNNDPEDTPCEAPACDKFALKVAGGPANLTLTNEVEDDDATGGIRVEKPDGSIVYASGPSATGKPFKLQIKAAPNGDYSVGMINNFIDGPQPYTGGAELAVPKPAAPAAPAPAPAPAPTGPAPAQDFTLTVKAPKSASARKLAKKRKLAVTVTVSREVAKITAKLAKGSKTAGTGFLGRTSGTKKLTVKTSRKLKKGSYKLTVAATDAQGTTVVRTLPIKVKR